MSDKFSSIIDIRDIWGIVWKRKWVIIIPLILCTASGYGVSFLITPEYESFAIVAISQKMHLSNDIQNLLGINPRYQRENRRDQLRGIYNELTSSSYLYQVASQLKLDQDPELDKKARNLASLQQAATLEDIKFDLLQQDLKETIDVRFVAQDQIRLQVQSTKPRLARDIANTLGEVFITEKLKQELTSIRSSQDFSDVQLQKYERALQDKIAERTRVEQRLLQVRLDESITSEANRSEINSEIQRANQEINDYRDDERGIVSQLSGVQGLSVNNLELEQSDQHSELSNDLRNDLSALSEQMTQYSWSNPQIINFKVRLNNTLRSIEDENESQVNGQFSQFDDNTRDLLVRLFNIRSNLDFLYSKSTYLTSARQELTDKMNLIPELQADLNRLNQEVAAATDIRDRFQRQQESSTISQALLQDASSSKYRIVEPAKLPLEPFKPDRRKIIAMGLAIGMVLGAGVVLMFELMDSSLKKVEDVEEFTGLRVLGIAPKAPFMKRIRA